MHEFDVVPSFLGKPVESVCQSTGVFQKIERVTVRSIRQERERQINAMYSPEQLPALHEQFVEHALSQ